VALAGFLAGLVFVVHDVPYVLVATLGPTWGLHFYDLNADQGDLITLARRQAESWG
jgi:hypothetical protein